MWIKKMEGHRLEPMPFFGILIDRIVRLDVR
jgi:hypothetical protein